MPTAVPGNTPHLTKTANVGAGAYKFVPFLGAPGDAKAGYDPKKKGVSWCKVSAHAGDIYVQPDYSVTGATPTAWDASPAPGVGAISEALLLKSGASEEFGLRPSDETGTDSAPMISGLHIWAVGATTVGIVGL